MDLHIIPGVKAKDVAEAHCQDIKNQAKYHCKCMTYWIDEKRDSVFCLIEAPNKDAIRELHDASHGLIPHEIIPVNNNLVEAFLGRIQDPETFSDLANPDLKIFNDPAIRTILVAQIMDLKLMKHKYGKLKANQLSTLFLDLVKEQVIKYKGRIAGEDEHELIISFKYPNQAIDCADSIQKTLHIAGDLVELKLGIHAGMPVENSNLLFGETVKFCKQLICTAKKNQILISSSVQQLYQENIIDSNKSLRILNPSDQKFIQDLFETIENNWRDSSFEIHDFCKEMSMSKSNLYRKCTELTGQSINSFLKEYRLSKALDNLNNSNKNISQIAFDTGFNSPSYFTKCFQKRFDIQPHSY